MSPERLLAAIGCLYGAAGVALLAVASHGPWPAVTYAAIMVLAHAIAFVALAAALKAGLLQRRLALIASFGLAFAVALFAGDVTLHAVTGARLFPMAAPTGGSLSIGAWLLLAVAAVLG
jgi:uncharacterized membrane protein YgdD (TMEM256/DUF423 family)